MARLQHIFILVSVYIVMQDNWRFKSCVAARYDKIFGQYGDDLDDDLEDKDDEDDEGGYLYNEY